MRRFRQVRRDKKTNVPSKYLAGAKNRSKKAKEIKETAEKYKKGQYIDIKAINKSRTAQNDDKKKATKRKNKTNTKRKSR
jgi:hypothetical protein